MTVSEVDKLIRSAPWKHCPLDPVQTWLVKHAADVLAPVITTICNASLQSGCFPDFYKQARATARPKKPSLNPDDLNSFRPISNLSFLSKIIERVVVKHAVRPSRRSERASSSQTISLPTIPFHQVSSAGRTQRHRTRFDDGHVAALALLDLSSAFDSVDHSTLLSILRSRFSVTEQPLEWFCSYLTGRTQVFTTHPLWPNSSNTAHVRCATRLESWSSTIHIIHRIYNRYLFLTLRSIPHVCRQIGRAHV